MNATLPKMQKIKISPLSPRYYDNDEEVAFFYRGYFICKKVWHNVGERGGSREEWNFGLAKLVETHIGSFWDIDSGKGEETCDSRRECVAAIDQVLSESDENEEPAAQAAEPTPEQEPPMNTFRYSITSHVSHRPGQHQIRLYDAVAICRETGLRFPLGVTTSRKEAKAMCDLHKAQNIPVD